MDEKYLVDGAYLTIAEVQKKAEQLYPILPKMCAYQKKKRMWLREKWVTLIIGS